MIVNRALEKRILEKLTNEKKAILLYGARQIGKTTLCRSIIEKLHLKTLSINADEGGANIEALSSRNFNTLRELVRGYELLFIDEAQRIPDIGVNLKILVDRLPECKIIATGSSSFDLAHKITEPMTGRAWSYTLHPIAFSELKEQYNAFELNEQLEERLIYGSYPEVLQGKGNAWNKEYLEQISNAYLYKDILELANIRNSKKIRDLLKLLAFQIGSEVSMSELASTLGMGRQTVEHYIDLLEKSFVIFRLGGLSRNLRKEVTKMDKIYFYDLGIRNVIIGNFNTLNNRDDKGKLWENFLITERMKYKNYSGMTASTYFWRTYTGAELDYVEESGGILSGYEFKSNTVLVAAPKTWLETYSNATFETINTKNYLPFIGAV